MHAGSVMVCGGHGAVVVCGGHGVVRWCVVDMGQCAWWCVVDMGQCAWCVEDMHDVSNLAIFIIIFSIKKVYSTHIN